MGDTIGLVGVRVVAQGKTVDSRELVAEERRNKAPSNLIRVRTGGGTPCRGDRKCAGVEVVVRVHRIKSNGLAM